MSAVALQYWNSVFEKSVIDLQSQPLLIERTFPEIVANLRSEFLTDKIRAKLIALDQTQDSLPARIEQATRLLADLVSPANGRDLIVIQKIEDSISDLKKYLELANQEDAGFDETQFKDLQDKIQKGMQDIAQDLTLGALLENSELRNIIHQVFTSTDDPSEFSFLINPLLDLEFGDYGDIEALFNASEENAYIIETFFIYLDEDIPRLSNVVAKAYKSIDSLDDSGFGSKSNSQPIDIFNPDLDPDIPEQICDISGLKASDIRNIKLITLLSPLFE